MLEDIIRQYGGVEVEPMEVYSDIFHLGEGLIQKKNEPKGQFKANPIAYWKNNNHEKGHYRILFEDTFEETLKECQDADFSLINGLSYFGRKNTQEHASKMYALIFDYDGVDENHLDNFLHGAFSKEYFIYPIPNYMVLSGHGLHLYYVFEEPIPLFPNIKLQLKALKYALTERMWNDYTSTEKIKQFQGINQGFRPIGGKTKIEGVRSRAFMLHNHPFCLEQLNRYVPEESRIDESKLWRESKMTLEEAKKKYPEWYQSKVLNKEDRRTWTTKRDLYDWWKRQIHEGATFHHRYFNIMCLAIYAIKAGIEYEELERDALELIPFLDDINKKEPFTEKDVYSALECYDLRYKTFPIDDIAKISAIPIEKNKRNGRKQKQHCEVMRAIQNVTDPEGKWRNRSGAPTKRDMILFWQTEHPEGTKADCIRDLGLSKPTVYKWWQDRESGNQESSIERAKELLYRIIYFDPVKEHAVSQVDAIYKKREIDNQFLSLLYSMDDAVKIKMGWIPRESNYRQIEACIKCGKGFRDWGHIFMPREKEWSEFWRAQGLDIPDEKLQIWNDWRM